MYYDFDFIVVSCYNIYSKLLQLGLLKFGGIANYFILVFTDLLNYLFIYRFRFYIFKQQVLMIATNSTQLKQKQIKGRVVILQPKSKHVYTLIWIHGLHQTPEKYLHIFKNQLFANFKVIALEAPTRYVTILKQNVTSWFDIKFRSETSFKVPFDEAFSTKQVLQSFQEYIKPWVHKSAQELGKVQGSKLIISGFSQGCGMSLHSFAEEKDRIDAVIGIAGYMFPFTKWEKTDKFHRVLYGRDDNIRPWQYTKQTYAGKIEQNKIILVENTKHQINQEMIRNFHQAIRQLLKLFES